MRCVFWGTDDFARRCWEALISSPVECVGCVTPPDRPAGRGLKTKACAVKAAAEAVGIPVIHEKSFSEENFREHLISWRPDLFVVVSYGRILPANYLEIPRRMAINVHPSLLPKYRGAAPIPWALIRGETVTGVSLIRMKPEMDAGDILDQVEVPIFEDDDALSLRDRLAGVAADRLAVTVKRLSQGEEVDARPQDERHVTWAPRITKAMGCLSWGQAASELHRWVRGLCPSPGAYSFLAGQRVRILKTKILNKDKNQELHPGQVVEIMKDGVIVQTGEGLLQLLEVQPESGRRMAAASWAAGRRVKPGDEFSDRPS